jgi:hypothetical protein
MSHQKVLSVADELVKSGWKSVAIGLITKTTFATPANDFMFLQAQLGAVTSVTLRQHNALIILMMFQHYGVQEYNGRHILDAEDLGLVDSRSWS